MITTMNIEKQVKDNFEKNGKKKDEEKRSRDDL